jgi:glyoxylate utilization-related uncharacterized protein
VKDSGDWEDTEPGVRRRILVAQGRLMLMEVQFAAGAAGYEHQHSHEQISYCVSGRFEYSLDGRTHVLSTGESIYVTGKHPPWREGARRRDADRRVHANSRRPAGVGLAREALNRRARASPACGAMRPAARRTRGGTRG